MNTTPAPRTSKHGSSKKRAGARNAAAGGGGGGGGKRAARANPPLLDETVTATIPTMDEPPITEQDVEQVEAIEEKVAEGVEEVSAVEEEPAFSDGLGVFEDSSAGFRVEDNYSVDLAFNPFDALDRYKEPTSFSMDEKVESMSPIVLNSDDEGEPAGGAVRAVTLAPMEVVDERDEAVADIMARSRETQTDPEQRPAETSRSPLPAPSLSAGRTRAPILIPSNPASPSSLSRQLKNVQALLPTSPSLKTAGFGSSLSSFAAPRISNVTVSGLSFTNPGNTLSSPTSASNGSKDVRRRSTGTQYIQSTNSGPSYGYGPGARARDQARLSMTPQTPSRTNDSDDDSSSYMSHPYSALPYSAQHTQVTQYPSATAAHDRVVFAAFGEVSLPSVDARQRQRLLMIGYENGLQIWNISNLGNVTEVVNRRFSGAVVGCSVLPEPRSVARPGKADKHARERPLIGILVEEHDSSYLLAYSLVSHKVVERLDFSGASFASFQASDSFIVVSTVSPFSLHILCSRTFVILHTIQARQLSIFSRPVSFQTPEGTIETIYQARQDRPHAVFDLSSRLLAFASSPTPELSTLTNIYPKMAHPQSPSFQIGPYNVSQADVGNAAMKVGGGLLSGMKTLGGLAVSAARGDRSSGSAAPTEGGLRKFFSRSAPAAASSSRVDRSKSEGDAKSEPGRGSSDMGRESSHITVLDLQPLLDEESDRPETLAEFAVPSGQVVAGIRFTDDGTGLGVIPDDGGTVRVYHIKPRSRIMRSVALANTVQGKRDRSTGPPKRQGSSGSVESTTSVGKEQLAASAAWHVYDLRRGRTYGIVESLDFSHDGRWSAFATRNRTIHLFATNPYGGRPDEASHLEGRVKNIDKMQPLSITLPPVLRLKPDTTTTSSGPLAPLAFVFLSQSPDALPSKLLPAHNTLPSPSSVSSSIPLSSATQTHQHQRTHSVSPRLPSRQTNYQDILIFDPMDGSLYLRRVFLSSRVVESGTAANFLSALPIPTATSISLPGMGFMGRQGMSPPKLASAASSTPTTGERLQTELEAKDKVIATWKLSRDPKGYDACEPLMAADSQLEPRKGITKAERLAQFELSTSSRSTSVLPGSIYLSHQFSFFTFGDDYHALIRRHNFDIPSSKLDVRKEVEARPFSSGRGESFISGASSPHDVRASRPFDEPLTSAMFTDLEYSSSSPPVIPMLPNGARPGSFKASIPIRSVASGITGGVNEGIGRLSRSLRKVRSPRLNPRSDESSQSVPLEFDEEDELFISEHSQERSDHGHDDDHDNDTLSNSNSVCGGRDSRSVSTPSTNNNTPLPPISLHEETGPEGWLDDMDAVEEAESFDEVDPVRIVDDERRQQQRSQIRVAGWDLHRGTRKGL